MPIAAEDYILLIVILSGALGCFLASIDGAK